MEEILFLPISGPIGASSRYRVLQFLPRLVAEGISHTVHIPSAPTKKGLARLLDARREHRTINELLQQSQVIFIQKRLFPTSWIEAWADARPLLFDFDDAIFTTPQGQRSLLAQRRVEHRLRHTLSAAHTVISGNRYLSDYAAQFTRRIIHLPTVVDTHLYPAKKHIPAKPIVIGWIGHSVNHPYLAGLNDVLGKLAHRFDILLLIVSDRDLIFPGIVVENRRWSEKSEIADILQMDIGIMPMPDDPWTRGKCGLKAIQYMAAGLPVVCSAVGANREIVRDGVDGFCPSSPSQWFECLAALCADHELRQQMGTAGRARAQNIYSLEALFPRWLAVLRAALEPGANAVTK